MTGRALTPETAATDFIEPLHRDGTPTIGNLQIVHADAHAAKGRLPLAAFISLCREVVAHADSQAKEG